MVCGSRVARLTSAVDPKPPVVECVLCWQALGLMLGLLLTGHLGQVLGPVWSVFPAPSPGSTHPRAGQGLGKHAEHLRQEVL